MDSDRSARVILFDIRQPQDAHWSSGAAPSIRPGEARSLTADGVPDAPWALIQVTDTGLQATSHPMWRRSLVWANDGDGRFAVSQHLLDIVRWLPPDRRELRPDFALRWLTATTSGDHTPYQHVHAIRPGTSLTVDREGWARTHTWFGEDDLPSPTLRGPEAGRQYLAAFDSVVAAIIADQDVLALRMSGGLDSTFVAAAVAVQGRDVHAFVHTPLVSGRLSLDRGWLADDWPYAQAVSAYLSPHVELHPVRPPLDGTSPLDWGESRFTAAGVPAFNSCNLAWMDLARDMAQQEGVRMILGGGMGNATFSDAHRAALAAAVSRRDMRSAARIARAELHGSIATSSLRAVAGKVRRGWRNRTLAVPGGRAVCPWLDDGADEAVRQWRGDVVDLSSWGRNRLVNGPPMLSDPGVGLPTVDPFASVAVARAAASIAPDEWIRGPAPRGFARRLGKGRVPDSVRLRPTFGAQGIDAWGHMQGSRQDYLDEAEGIADTQLGDIVDAARFVRAVRSWPWGQQQGPISGEVVSAERVLVLARFLRWHRSQLTA